MKTTYPTSRDKLAYSLGWFCPNIQETHIVSDSVSRGQGNQVQPRAYEKASAGFLTRLEARPQKLRTPIPYEDRSLVWARRPHSDKRTSQDLAEDRAAMKARLIVSVR